MNMARYTFLKKKEKNTQQLKNTYRTVISDGCWFVSSSLEELSLCSNNKKQTAVLIAQCCQCFKQMKVAPNLRKHDWNWTPQHKLEMAMPFIVKQYCRSIRIVQAIWVPPPSPFEIFQRRRKHTNATPQNMRHGMYFPRTNICSRHVCPLYAFKSGKAENMINHNTFCTDRVCLYLWPQSSCLHPWIVQLGKVCCELLQSRQQTSVKIVGVLDLDQKITVMGQHFFYSSYKVCTKP